MSAPFVHDTARQYRLVPSLKSIASASLVFILKHRAVLAVGICSIIALSHIQYANRRLLDWDIYYHLKFSLLSLHTGIMQDFPWCQFSLFKPLPELQWI